MNINHNENSWGEVNENPHCETNEFKSDISELCVDCGLTKYIKDGIKNQIVFQAEMQKSILTPEQFYTYCDGQIKILQDAMMKANLARIRHEKDSKWEGNIPNINWILIWNKEAIKALNVLLLEQKKAINVSEKKILRSCFAELFTHTSKYVKVKEILIEEGLCDEISFRWVDTGSGYKQLIVGLLKRLNELGYYDKMPTNEEIKIISENTFGVEIGIDTIKKAKSNRGNLKFIPYADTL
jgi:hypothetical protein